MKLFLGEYDHTLDDRGRITLPRKIRHELDQPVLILSKGFDGCIFGYDLQSWNQESEKQLITPVTDNKGREIRRYMFAAAEKTEIDKLGRILLPTHLKEYGEIVKEVKIIGAGDHLEIWDKNRWENYSKKWEKA
jgi:MraZ protein